MRSILYVLFGRPFTIDDYIDFAAGRRSGSVEIQLKTVRSVSEMFFLTSFVVRFVWRFEGTETVCEKAIFSDAGFGNDLDERAMAKANLRLQGIISKLERGGIDVINREKRFARAPGAICRIRV
jgi:hypothetical protein